MEQGAELRIIAAKWESFAIHLPTSSQGATSVPVVHEFNKLLKLTREQLKEIVPYLPTDINERGTFQNLGVCPIDSGQLRVLAMQVLAAISAAYPSSGVGLAKS